MPHATGEYVAFLDSDDFVETDIYELMYNKAKEDNSDVVECDFYWTYPKKEKEDVGIIYNGVKEAIVNARVLVCNKLIKRSLLQTTKIKFPKGLRYEDVEFFYKLVTYIKKNSFVKKPLMHYVQRENSISNNQNEKNSDIFKILDNVIEFYKEENLYEEYKEELEYIYARYLLCSSFKRMVHIKDKNVRKKLLNKTWNNLSNTFPNWKSNKILNTNKNNKNRYMKTVNKFTYKIYSAIFRLK